MIHLLSLLSLLSFKLRTALPLFLFLPDVFIYFLYPVSHFITQTPRSEQVNERDSITEANWILTEFSQLKQLYFLQFSTDTLLIYTYTHTQPYIYM